jgi:O-antigen/teichoic acid export membrane protein
VTLGEHPGPPGAGGLAAPAAPGDAVPRSLSRDAVESFIVRVILVPVGFATVVVTSRYLMPAGRGAWVLAVLGVSIAITLLGNGGIAASHQLVAGASAREAIGRVLPLAAVTGVVASVVLLPAFLLTAPGSYRIGAYLLLGLPAAIVLQTALGSLLGVGRIRLWNGLQLVAPTLTLAAMLVAVVAFGREFTGATAAWVAGQGVAAVAALAVMRRWWWPPVPGTLALRDGLATIWFGAKVGASNLVGLINYRIELAVLEIVEGLRDVGVYSISVATAELLFIPSAALSSVLVSRMVGATDREAASLIARGTTLALVITAVAGAALAGIGIIAIEPVFGADYSAAVRPMLILIPGIVLFAPVSVLATWFSVRLGKPRYPVLTTAAAAGTTAILAPFLIEAVGITGASIASTAGYTVGCAASVFWFVRLSGVGWSAVRPQLAAVELYRWLGPRLSRG